MPIKSHWKLWFWGSPRPRMADVATLSSRFGGGGGWNWSCCSWLRCCKLRCAQVGRIQPIPQTRGGRSFNICPEMILLYIHISLWTREIGTCNMIRIYFIPIHTDSRWVQVLQVPEMSQDQVLYLYLCETGRLGGLAGLISASSTLHQGSYSKATWKPGTSSGRFAVWPWKRRSHHWMIVSGASIGWRIVIFGVFGLRMTGVFHLSDRRCPDSSLGCVLQVFWQGEQRQGDSRPFRWPDAHLEDPLSIAGAEAQALRRMGKPFTEYSAACQNVLSVLALPPGFVEGTLGTLPIEQSGV